MELACGHTCGRKCGQSCECPKGCPSIWDKQVTAEETNSIDTTNSTENVEDDEPPRGRQRSRSLKEATNSWTDFAKVTRADEKAQAAKTIDATQADKDSSSARNDTSTLPSVTKHGVTITQISKRQVSPQRKGVARFRYESSYTVAQLSKTEPVEEPAIDIPEEAPVLKSDTSGFVDGPVKEDVIMGDLIDL